jgi:hypothetical protein
VNRPALNQPTDLWLVDGTLRDVYVFNTAAGDWDALLLLAQTHTHEYKRDGVTQPLPGATTLLQDREHSHLLSVLAGPVRINCHFFVQEQIELDIDPQEIGGTAEHLAVLQLLEQLAQATRKDVVVTPENLPEAVLLHYNQANRTWRVDESHAGEA